MRDLLVTWYVCRFPLMATVEMITAGCKGDQEETTSSKENTPSVLSESNVNFSELTPLQFGISVESFTPASSSQRRDKSRLAHLKARRRSSVGVRGSPETNSLIRFMAQQKMKTPPTTQTPEIVRSSPFVPRVASTLKEKMASFQSLMDVVEREACGAMPELDGGTGGCRTPLSERINLNEGKENNPPAAPTSSKRRRLDSVEICSLEISEASGALPASSLKEQERAECRVQSPAPPPSADPAAASSSQRPAPFLFCSLPLLLDPKAPEEEAPPVVKVKKQVRFGGPLSPEFFDKNLPPSTPLQKGGTPARAPTPGGDLLLRSVLKTPQSCEARTAAGQRDQLSPSEFEASPALVSSGRHRIKPEGHNGEDNHTKIVFPLLDETDSALTSDTDNVFDPQPLNLDTAFHEEHLSHSLPDVNFGSSTSCQVDKVLVENQQQKEGAEDSVSAQCNDTQTATELKATSEAPRSRRKRKQPEESEPVKRSTRSAAKSACGRLKVTSTRKWNKGVDRSLYGSRAYASKNPTLSPIRERLSLSGRPPAVSCSETPVRPEIADAAVVRDVAVENTPADVSRLRGRRGAKMRKVSVPDSQEPQDFEDQTAAVPQGSRGLPSQLPEARTPDADSEDLCSQSSADTSEKSHETLSPAPAEKPDELPDCTEELTSTDEAVGEAGEGPPISSGVQEEVGGDADLAPWQADFNFEDVFKPVTTRGQRSVRRSLRNQSNVEHGAGEAGLAWVPHTSPESIRETRRKTGGRRRSAAPPVQPALPEEDCTLT
ncbi:Cell division cycle-associated protein 2 [Oryzias melastigma]|uniref:Cell division cycle-associated protein 2 n=1 Tax=Oryzias melastigma TaxID=30732 RepID=A0A834F9L5_ORYME|nr:Cell division cycle-associated protein 2 [Oryzias melastigma]